MRDTILKKYNRKRVLAVYTGKDAWKKIVPIRWSPASRAAARRRFKNVDMSNALLIIFVTPKTGTPKKIGVHFYPNANTKISKINKESNDLWITEAPYSLLKLKDAPKLLKNFLQKVRSKS